MKPGLLVISHGSKDAGWVALVDEAVEEARARLGDALAIEAVFLELVEGRLIQDGIDRMLASGVTHVLALPLFVSAGSTHVDEIGWALGAYPEPKTDTDLERYFTSSLQLTYGKPMDDDPELVDIVLDRLKEMSIQPPRESILLVGHGSEIEGFQEAWERGLNSIAEQVLTQGGYRSCSTALLLPDQVVERLDSLQISHPDDEVLVVGLFLSEGYFTKEVVPGRLMSSERALGYRYTGHSLMPHPKVISWIVRQVREWQEGWN
ncbi:sirohydrochlorin chelatase [Cohnella mopanensis]|uniref:sirohydrochlorin chelatase n=1 Tax=Cohnella mopanensis TaxID=2911966 RepID=UPI001EF8FB59|nr:CbiX/SirB N-terminal domain-containing protein [Cohnella mopanensis]